MKKSTILRVFLIVLTLCALLMGTLGASAVEAATPYAVRDYPVRNITNDMGASGLTEYSRVSIDYIRPNSDMNTQIIDTVYAMFQNPNDFVDTSAYDYPDGPYTKNGKPLADFWVFKINYANSAGDVILDPFKFRSQEAVNYTFHNWTIALKDDLGYEYGINDFGVFYLDMNFDYENEAYKGPKSTVKTAMKNGAGEYFNDLMLGAEATVDAAAGTLVFQEQWPMWYALAYFSDDPDYEPAAATATVAPTPTATAAPQGTEAPTATATATAQATNAPEGTQAPQATVAPTQTPSASSPANGDTSPLPYVLLATLCLAAIGGMLILRRN